MQMRQHATCNKARLATMKAHMKYERANEALHERCHAKLLQHTHTCGNRWELVWKDDTLNSGKFAYNEEWRGSTSCLSLYVMYVSLWQQLLCCM